MDRYPKSSEITLDMRGELHTMLSALTDGLSEESFANLYLFGTRYGYRVSMIDDDILLITGKEPSDGEPFFMLPVALPPKDLLDELFAEFKGVKSVSRRMASEFEALAYGYRVTEDRDNFDYLYLRADLAEFSGRKFHKKKNRLKHFTANYHCEGRSLLAEYMDDALKVLDMWREEREIGEGDGDYLAARTALLEMEELQLCGDIYYIDSAPVAYTLGEELGARGDTFVTHFEKATVGKNGRYKGLFQFVVKGFASHLPEKYIYINREQDLGLLGLREAKTGLRPVKFVKKYRVIQSGKD